MTEVLQWRREIESGARPGPRIKTAGQILETRANVERMKREATVEPVDVLLNGNPIEDIRRTRQIAGVARDGRWFDRAALDALLERSALEARQ